MGLSTDIAIISLTTIKITKVSYLLCLFSKTRALILFPGFLYFELAMKYV